MPRIFGPVDLTGADQLLPQAPAPANELYDRVVINNHSPYLLQLTNGGNRGWIHPFMGDLFPYDPGADVLVSPNLMGVLAGNPHHCCLEYYQPGEDIPGKSYPSMMAQFQTATQLADSPFLAANTGLTTGVEQFPAGGEPATKYSSYQLRLSFSNGAASPSNYAQASIRFWHDLSLTKLIWEDTVEVNPGNVRSYITDRLHGAQMSILPTFPGGTLDCTWLFSNRSAPRLQCLEAPAGNDRILLARSSVVVGAGNTSADQFVPLFNGPCDISLDASAGVTALWSFYFGSLAPIAFKIPFSGAALTQEAILPLRPLHYTVQNTGASQQTFFTSIWARDN
jgi:hypothetical protein